MIASDEYHIDLTETMETLEYWVRVQQLYHE